MKYGNLTLGQIEAIVNRLGGEEAAMRFLRGELVLKESEQLATASSPIQDFAVWWTVTVGHLKDFKQTFERLEAAGVTIKPRAKPLIQGVKFLQTEAILELTKVSVMELGLPSRVSTQQIYERAKEKGLELCPPEVAFQIWLTYPYALRGTGARVATVPLIDNNNVSYLLGMGRYSSRNNLNVYDAFPSKGWHALKHFIFVKPK